MKRRILGSGRSYYHVMSRVVDRNRIFEARDKEFFRRQMRVLEKFTGVEALAYCFMGNHFHLLLMVPEKSEIEPLTEESLRSFLPEIHGQNEARSAKEELDRAVEEKADGDGKALEELLERYEERRADLPAFMKSLKHRMTLRMNQRLDRTGTLWEGRYKSVLVEGEPRALLAVAAYIDLNPVRANLVDRPEEYRWCGYAEAVSGKGKQAERARSGLTRAVRGGVLGERGSGKEGWGEVRDRYRCYLYAEGKARKGDETGKGRAGIDQAESKAVSGGGGKLSLEEALRCRVRYLTDGAVLGSAEFVEEVFEREKAGGRFGKKRKSGARKMKGAEWGELRVLRNLKENVIVRGMGRLGNEA